MEEMKNRFCLLLPLLFNLMLASCATTSAGTSDINIEKKQSNKKLLFKDWKYRGFGYELPVWFEAAYNDDEPGLKKALPELQDKEVTILRGQGFNSDQAEQNLKLKLAEAEALTFYDSGWAMLDVNEYISIAILYKEM